MKFKCFHRVASGAIECVNLDAPNRHAAFKVAQSNNWLVAEMRPVASDVKPCKVKKTIVDRPKYPNAEELALLRIRRASFWIGFWLTWLPIIGLVIALIATFFKYDMRGLKCCVHGIFAVLTPSFFIGLAMRSMAVGMGVWNINPFLTFVCCIMALGLAWFGWWYPHYTYRKYVLMGYTVNSWDEEL